MTKMYIKLMTAREKARKALTDNSGQGAVDTAIICEPFSLEWEV